MRPLCPLPPRLTHSQQMDATKQMSPPTWKENCVCTEHLNGKPSCSLVQKGTIRVYLDRHRLWFCEAKPHKRRSSFTKVWHAELTELKLHTYKITNLQQRTQPFMLVTMMRRSSSKKPVLLAAISAPTVESFPR